MTDRKEFYQQRIDFYTEIAATLERRSKNMSFLRLLCFAAMGYSLYLCFNTAYVAAQIALTGLFFIAFLSLILRHSKIQQQRASAEKLRVINQNEFNVLNGQPSILNDGSQYFSTDSYLYDLDIFGKGSLFHLLNRTATAIGNKALSDILKKPYLDPQAIIQQQQAVTELSSMPDLRQDCLAANFDEQGTTSDVRAIDEWVNNKQNTSRPWWKYAIIAAPLILMGCLIWGMINHNYYLFSAVFILNLMISFAYSKKIAAIHAKLSGAGKAMSQYALLFKTIQSQTFKSRKLTEIHNISAEAHRQLKALSKLVNLFDQRMNLLVAVFFNALFFYDFLCVLRLEKWRTQNASKTILWFEAIAEFEVLNSLATFSFNNPDYVMPVTGDPDGAIIKAQDLAHPLIRREKRISNDVDFTQQSRTILITGSNMSGKSTFLRTVGVNLLLASCGTVVCASRFIFYPVKIYSSLRQNDSLQEDTSFFYAELKRLSSIVQHLEWGERALVLLDEVLKGTNSDDKTYGSHQLILRLIRFKALSLMATHDISLGTMENETQGLVENYCFESTIDNDELIFDYQLRKGVAINKNATFLMKKMHIID